MNVLPVCMCAMCKDGYKQPVGPLEKQQVLLTTEPTLQPIFQGIKNKTKNTHGSRSLSRINCVCKHVCMYHGSST